MVHEAACHIINFPVTRAGSSAAFVRKLREVLDLCNGETQLNKKTALGVAMEKISSGSDNVMLSAIKSCKSGSPLFTLSCYC